jgi:tetratricopeptide (TPR) repeat protein
MTAWLYDWDWAAADREFNRSIELNPNYPTAHHWYGLYLGEMGRFDQAIAEEKRALILDPVSVPIYADLGRVYFYARRYNESLAQYQKAIELGPEWGSFYAELSMLYEQLGMYEEMIQTLEKLTREPQTELRQAYSANRMNDYWRKTVVGAERRGVSFSGHSYLAGLYAKLGERDKAIHHLWAAYEAHDHMVTQLKVNATVDPLRSDPRFIELMRRLNLAP